MSIKVVRQDKPDEVVMHYIEPVDRNITVEKFKQKLCAESEYLSKCSLFQ